MSGPGDPDRGRGVGNRPGPRSHLRIHLYNIPYPLHFPLISIITLGPTWKTVEITIAVTTPEIHVFK